MTYYVNQKCRGCKFTDCVSVCPVDCFYEGDEMLVIDPSECIDCGVCVPECPVDAIKSDCDDSVPFNEMQEWIQYNASYALLWKENKITKPKEPLCPYPENWKK